MNILSPMYGNGISQLWNLSDLSPPACAYIYVCVSGSQTKILSIFLQARGCRISNRVSVVQKKSFKWVPQLPNPTFPILSEYNHFHHIWRTPSILLHMYIYMLCFHGLVNSRDWSCLESNVNFYAYNIIQILN